MSNPPTADEDTRIGIVIYQHRMVAGFKRVAFAKACKMKTNRLEGIESGTRKIRPHELYRVAVMLEVTMERLMDKPTLDIFD